ncbi:isoprenylcysteine carboxylmethyltransferase family protein [Bacillus sp. BRMEA1]|uniref:methyltransferase family protein n=1 Tax=Neobacillus endophyticus TaxID=2738405 RepID=UPI001563BE9A|nr:isoprenylcysteine carboxylmethyltransferase family protein [Neobacillus endophyticus]NRD78130.1 isoprenylcysteine carboxylmethyltransferase family protein [Neobacillus endophyticus]
MSIIKVTIYLWSVFWAYWMLLAISTRKKVKKEYSGQERTQRIVHLIFVIISFVITFFRVNFIDKIIIPSNYAFDSLGGVILLLSLSLAVWARIILGRNWSGAIQKVENQRLIRNGPYKHIRHPIYTGIVCGFCGTFLIFGTLASFIGFLIILFSYIAKIKIEENFLVTEFGDEYREYMKQSWALVPFIF